MLIAIHGVKLYAQCFITLSTKLQSMYSNEHKYSLLYSIEYKASLQV